ncbi:hypothetical protein MMC2321_00117 [Chitinophaga sp. MM2321]
MQRSDYSHTLCKKKFKAVKASSQEVKNHLLFIKNLQTLLNYV